MATSTTNYGLVKPAAGDPVSITPINANMDTIDTTLKTLDGRTGASIPISARDTRNIGPVLTDVEARTGASIPVSTRDTRYISTALDELNTAINGLNGDSIPIDSSAGAGTIKAAITAITPASPPVLTGQQTLDASTQTQVRTNIGAASAADITSLQGKVVKYKDVQFSQGVVVSADGTQAGNVLTITSSAAGVDLSTVTFLGVLIMWAWPMTGWDNGAIVVINNVALDGSNLVVHLATTFTQGYMLTFRILYTEG